MKRLVFSAFKSVFIWRLGSKRPSKLHEKEGCGKAIAARNPSDDASDDAPQDALPGVEGPFEERKQVENGTKQLRLRLETAI